MNIDDFALMCQRNGCGLIPIGHTAQGTLIVVPCGTPNNTVKTIVDARYEVYDCLYRGYLFCAKDRATIKAADEAQDERERRRMYRASIQEQLDALAKRRDELVALMNKYST